MHMANSSPVGLPQPQRRYAIMALAFGTGLLVVDNNIPTVALPTIAQSLHVSASASVIVITIYQMVLLMAVLPFSALGDRLGLKRMYQGGQTLFLASTLLAALAPNFSVLLVARAGQAIGCAGALSVGMALMRQVYPVEHLGRGFGLNGLIIAGAASIAPSLGGLVLALGSWRWVFAIAVPFALISLLLGHSLPVMVGHRTSFDRKGAILCAATFGLTTIGLQIGRENYILTGILVVLGMAIGALFVRRELRQEVPILPVDLLAMPTFALSASASLVASAASMIFILSLPFRLGTVLGFGPVAIGAVLAAWPLTMMISAPIAGRLVDRTRGGFLGTVGMLCSMAGLTLMVTLPQHASLFRVIASMVLGGAGYGLFISPNSYQIMNATPHERSASAGALISTIRLTGGDLGGTLLGMLLAYNLGSGAAPTLVAMGFVSLAALLSVCNLRRHPHVDVEREAVPPAEKTSDVTVSGTNDGKPPFSTA